MCHRSRSIALIFLANELIQRSLASDKILYKKFRAIIKESIVNLFNQFGSGTNYIKEKVDVIKVVKVWEDRQIFEPEYLQDLKNQIEENLAFPIN